MKPYVRQIASIVGQALVVLVCGVICFGFVAGIARLNNVQSAPTISSTSVFVSAVAVTLGIFGIWGIYVLVKQERWKKNGNRI